MAEEGTEGQEGQQGAEGQQGGEQLPGGQSVLNSEGGQQSGGNGQQAPVIKVDHLPEDIRSDPAVKKHTKEDGTVAFDTLAKSLVHAEQLIGRDKVVIPKEGDDAETWNQFFRTLGRPDTPDAYEWPDVGEEAPDVSFDERWLGEFGKKAHELGVSKTQAQEMIKWFAKESQFAMEQSQAQVKGAQEQAMAELRREHGAATDNVVAGAQEVLRTFGDEEFADWVDSSGLGDSPQFINFLANVKGLMSEDVFGAAQRRSAGQGLAPADAQSRIMELKKDSAYMDIKDPRHKQIMEQISNLYSQAYPTEAGVVAVTRDQVRSGA